MKIFKLTKLGEERLRKMIQFLKELPEDEFNFSEVVSEYDENKCGTVCCAIGWTPKLFPELVHWDYSYKFYNLSMSDGVNYHYIGVASKLFGLTEDISVGLFSPSRQDDIHKNLPVCRSFSKPSDVASMLEKFIELCHKKKIKLKNGEMAIEPIPDNK